MSYLKKIYKGIRYTIRPVNNLRTYLLDNSVNNLWILTLFMLFACLALQNTNIINNIFTKEFSQDEQNIVESDIEPVEIVKYEIQNTEKEYIVENITIKRGDNIDRILSKYSIAPNDKIQIIKLAKKKRIDRKLALGNIITLEYKKSDQDNDNRNYNSLNSFKLMLDKLNSVEFARNYEGKFEANNIVTAVQKNITQHELTIKNNFISSLNEISLSNQSKQRLIRAISTQINLNKEIQNGNKIKLLHEEFIDQDTGEFISSGNILHASLETNNKKYELYYYPPKDNFYDNNGQLLSKNGGFAEPVKNSYISSHFGYRNHPILKRRILHKGADFKARTGTPIHATSDGIVTHIGYIRGYGNTVKIKHAGNIVTLYAHASRFNKNIKKGSHVKQGQVVAYVGKTGRATGPHLHYEIHLNGKPQNPAKFRYNHNTQLAKNDLTKFKKLKSDIAKLYNSTKFEHSDI